MTIHGINIHQNNQQKNIWAEVDSQYARVHSAGVAENKYYNHLYSFILYKYNPNMSSY